MNRIPCLEPKIFKSIFKKLTVMPELRDKIEIFIISQFLYEFLFILDTLSVSPLFVELSVRCWPRLQLPFNCIYLFLMRINNFINTGNSFKFPVPWKPGCGRLCMQTKGICKGICIYLSGGGGEGGGAAWIQVPLG